MAAVRQAAARPMATAVSNPASRRAGSRITFSQGLVAVVVLALVVRLGVIAATPQFVPATDAADYDRHAVSIAVHGSFPSTELAPAGGPTAFRPPLFPVVLAGVYKVVGVTSESLRWEAGRAAEAILGALAVALICVIALRLWGSAIALLSGAIAAVFPSLLLVGSSLMSEPLYICLVLGAVLAALVHRESAHRWRWAVVTGVLIGLAGLTRSNGLGLALPICVLVWTERPRWSWRALRTPLVVVTAAAVTLVPWTVRNAGTLHAFVPISTQSGYALAGTYNDYVRRAPKYPGLWVPPVGPILALSAGRRLNEAQLSGRLRQQSLDYIRARPGYLLQVTLVNTEALLNLRGSGLERYLAPFESYPRGLAELSVYGWWLLGALALAGAATRAARRPPAAFWACPVIPGLASIFFLGATRYRAPADPFVIMLAAVGLVAAWRRIQTRVAAGRRRSRSASFEGSRWLGALALARGDQAQRRRSRRKGDSTRT